MSLANVEFATSPDCIVAKLSGEVDQSNTRGLNEALTEAVPNGALALILDLSDVEYFDSSGIQLVYELRDKLAARGQVLRLVIPASSSSHAALRLAGVTRHVELFETEAEARDGGGAG